MVGIDLIENERIDKSDKFLQRIAHESEIHYISKTSNECLRTQKIGALFCVKEAVMKALGLGEKSGVVFKDIELSHDESGKPTVTLYGVAKERFEKDYKGKNIEVSISHTKTYSTAICVII